MNSTTTLTRLMRVESVADALDMTANTVRTLIKRGELKTVRIGMRSLRVPVAG